jgi:very-short-patch-repair endonuclease
MAEVKILRDNTLRDRARQLRRNQTEAEARLWNALRDRRLGGWKWRRQVTVGPYILDFLCPEGGLVVELDGGQHADQVAYDERRTRYLESRGLRVIRFWNGAVRPDCDGVCLSILAELGGEHPSVVGR